MAWQYVQLVQLEYMTRQYVPRVEDVGEEVCTFVVVVVEIAKEWSTYMHAARQTTFTRSGKKRSRMDQTIH